MKKRIKDLKTVNEMVNWVDAELNFIHMLLYFILSNLIEGKWRYLFIVFAVMSFMGIFNSLKNLRNSK